MSFPEKDDDENDDDDDDELIRIINTRAILFIRRIDASARRNWPMCSMGYVQTVSAGDARAGIDDKHESFFDDYFSFL